MADLSTERAIPMFPLPDVVLFPGVELPLHVFEPRYLELVQDALNADRRLVLATLKPGHEDQYHARPPVFDVATVARIARATPLPEHRFLILLVGERRVRVVGFDDHKAYRIARCKPFDADAILEDDGAPAKAGTTDTTQRLLALYALSQTADGRTTARMPSLGRDPTLPAVVNTLAFTAKLPTDDKLALLAQAIPERAGLLDAVLTERCAARLN